MLIALRRERGRRVPTGSRAKLVHWTLNDDQSRTVCGRIWKGDDSLRTASTLGDVECIRCLKIGIDNGIPKTVYGKRHKIDYTAIGAQLDVVMRQRAKR